jgi:hypothetical protein
MENITTKLKALISLIEKGNVKIDSLNEINSFLDALLDVNENLQSENKDKKLVSYRKNLENLDRNLLLKCIKVNELLLKLKKEEIQNQFDQEKNDTKKSIQLIDINKCVLNNLCKDFKSDSIENKLLFSHWKMSSEDFLIDFQTNNEIWDYATTYNYNNIYHITALGLDVPDDFDGKILSLKEPQISIASVLMKYPFNQQILVFFVNRNNIYYSNDLQYINPSFKETKDIRFFKSIISKATLLPRIKNLEPSNIDQQLLNLSKLFDKTLNEI